MVDISILVKNIVWRNLLLINEILEIKEWLNGENINTRCMYRTCYMLTKWYKEQGLSYTEIRDKIFAWGKENNVYIDFNLSSVVHRALEDYVPLRGDQTVIHINEDDVLEIKRKFDRKPYRKTALGILCYAKAVADEYNEFDISVLAFSYWLKTNIGNMSARYIKGLVADGYVKKINKDKLFPWDKKTEPPKSKSLRMEILVPIENNGDYILVGNDIDRLYSDIFEK